MEYSRQREIKELMAFSNISYFEANTQLKRDNTREFNISQQNFPRISQPNANNKISIQERRNKAIEENIIPSYSNTLRTPTTPKRKRTCTQGYDPKEFKEALINPNGRPQHVSPSRSQKENQQLDLDYQQAMSFLSQEHRELVMTLIGNLINNSYTLQNQHISEIVEIETSQVSPNNNQSQIVEGEMVWSEVLDQYQ